jgi:hypothetical protein
VTEISGKEADQNAVVNASVVLNRFDIGWTILVKKTEFESILPIEKNVTNLRNGTFTQYRTVVAY